jgi:hypothetical protein
VALGIWVTRPKISPPKKFSRNFSAAKKSIPPKIWKRLHPIFGAPLKEGRNRGEFCPVYERKEVVYWEQSLLGKPAQSEFQNAKEV